MPEIESGSRPIAEPRVELLLTTLEQAFRAKAWHGSTLRGALGNVRAEEAAWRPSPGRHNIWEITVHCAYWKHIALRRLAPESTGAFPEKGSDWFRRPSDPSEAAWKADLKLLGEIHGAFLSLVAELSDADLPGCPGGSTTRREDLIRGVAFHDVYHCGQIQLLKRMGRAVIRRGG